MYEIFHFRQLQSPGRHDLTDAILSLRTSSTQNRFLINFILGWKTPYLHKSKMAAIFLIRQQVTTSKIKCQNQYVRCLIICFRGRAIYWKGSYQEKIQICMKKQNGRHLKRENGHKCTKFSNFVSYRVQIFEVGKTKLAHCSL